jgi:hypothetical protein
MGSTAFVISLMAIIGLTMAMIGCWLKVGRDLVPPMSVFSIAGAILAKIPFYCRMVIQRNRHGWVRTDRRKS